MKWLTMLFGSVRAENLMKSLGFARDGNKIEAKSTEREGSSKGAAVDIGFFIPSFLIGLLSGFIWAAYFHLVK